MKKVYVCCPGGVVTGGPELLHQFVHELKNNNVEAYMLYMPFDKEFKSPVQYSHYDVSVANYNNTSFHDAVVVLPEVNTGLVNKFIGAKIVIWWLSVDFYYSNTGNNPIKDIISDKINLLRGMRTPLFKLKKHTHYVQSEYAKLFLGKVNIQSKLLTDYLGSAHLDRSSIENGCQNREKLIAYNPRKGVRFTQSFIRNNKDLKFVPIVNMTPLQVRELLSKAMIYIDFGHHPGKDRFPREAAMAGCCILTGKKGSAGNQIDVPIPSCYKFDENKNNVASSLRKLIDDIFDNFEMHTSAFDLYRQTIKCEPAEFIKQVHNFINDEL